jgi:phage shock protein PspC (stress-responsive transcriptional regulator)
VVVDLIVRSLAPTRGIDPTWLQIAYALGTLFTAVIAGVIFYGMLALIMPRDVPVKRQSVE